MSNEFALSAAHCKPEASLEGRLLVGSTSKKDMRDEDKLHEISDFIIHENYEKFEAPDAEFDIYDFMILKLSNKLHFCSSSFARLPPPNYDDLFLTGKTLTISGWGYMLEMSRERTKEQFTNPEKTLSKHAFPDHLRVAEVSYLPNKICQKRYNEFFTVEYANIEGTKKTLVKNLNFDTSSASAPGSSMLCTSTCVSEDISECKEHRRHSGTCAGDSGCKCIHITYLLCVVLRNI